ncbi:MAG: histidinol-phosphate transaminase [Spirosomaceae bacterium]|jgi:histidinol-phosphate aminotransferase|nr:histidinol-phosphate transaminase [Spirosomataceae bacterium]
MANNFELHKVIRPHILTLTPYSSARDEYTGKEGVFLDANENPYGSVIEGEYNRYPDPYQWAVKEKLAPIKGLRPTQIFLGNGSDEPIDLLIRATCEPQKDNILIMPPTYGMYKVCADIANINVIPVPLTSDFQIDKKAVLGAINKDTKLVWVCSPNNPSGNLLDKNDIIEIIENFDGIVVVDEAYIDFAESESFNSLLDKYPNLVVLQTFSKAWGMAALRLGMAFASEEIIKILSKIKYPYNLNAVTQKLLLEALGNEAKKNEYVAQILQERNYLTQKLAELPITKRIFPSDSNSLLVRFDKAKVIFNYLLENKVIVRDRSSVILCEDCLRITIGTREENDSLLSELKNFKH